ncbi:hypothetical protein KFE25_000077 [Diacronema lutheri]|uniref:Glycosyltransferase family 92 protein n=1 Tax=Diacronema lutheri TaxID=2081491 RepID=A0A8J5XNQ7_DIALT|nr:hypothetical protein KFE25_000077 [Diacronema lutheri]
MFSTRAADTRQRSTSLLAALLLVQAFGATPIAPPQRFVLFSRVFEDGPYSAFFVDYHLALGFDTIILLDARRGGQPRVSFAQPHRVHVHRVRNAGNDLLAEHFALVVASRAEWVFVADSDEFLLVDEPTIGAYVDRVERAHGPIDVFSFRWAMIDYFAPRCAHEVDFVRFVRAECCTPHFLHKQLSRVAKVRGLTPHCASWRDPSMPLRVFHDGVALTAARPNALCRTVNAANSTTPPRYATSVVHVHTRSITDLLIKALRTTLSRKRLRNPHRLVELMRAAPVVPRDELLGAFLAAVGNKAALPLANMATIPRRFDAQHGAGVAAHLVRQRLARLLPHAPTIATRRGICTQHLERHAVRALLAELTNATVSVPEYNRFAAAVAAAYIRERQVYERNRARHVLRVKAM